MRAAIMAANMMAMHMAKPMSDIEFSELITKLCHYLKVNQPVEQVVGPSKAARISGAK